MNAVGDPKANLAGLLKGLQTVCKLSLPGKDDAPEQRVLKRAGTFTGNAKNQRRNRNNGFMSTGEMDPAMKKGLPPRVDLFNGFTIATMPRLRDATHMVPDQRMPLSKKLLTDVPVAAKKLKFN